MAALVAPVAQTLYLGSFYFRPSSHWKSERLWQEHFIAKAAYYMTPDDLGVFFC